MSVKYEQLVETLSTYSKKRLVELLLVEKNNPGWTNTRAIYLSALKQVTHNKGLSV